MTVTNEFDALEQDLQAVFAVSVPTRRFTPPAPRTARRLFWRHGRWQLAAFGVAAAGLVGLVALSPGYLGGAQTVSAQELLTKSAETSAKLKTAALPYHIRESFEGKDNQLLVTETWSFGAAGNRSETRGQDGTLLYGQIATPTDAWLYATVDGQLRIVHIAGGEEARLRDFEAGTTSLEELIGGMVVPGCQEAISKGSASVAGRDAYVIEVVPTPNTCTAEASNPDARKLAAAGGDAGTFVVWIDKETTIQLKVEAHDSSGAVAKRYTALSLETGASIDRSALAFAVPSGASVVEAADYSEAKSALYGPGKPR